MSDVTLIHGGTVIGLDAPRRADVLVRDGIIVEVGEISHVPAGATRLDAAGCWVGPGFVDMHTHLREPGREAAETVESGARAAAMGGYSAVVAMPNTEPAIDNVVTATYVLAQGRAAVIDVTVAGAITAGRAGAHLADIAGMANLGVRIFTDDGTGVQDPLVMRRAMTYAAPLGIRLAQHCEDERLAGGGVMNEGAYSARLGLAGRPALSEELMVHRDIELVRLTGCPVHFLHLSTARSVELVVAARVEGLPVSCEVAPHHVMFDESRCADFDALFKVHPPLRTSDDVSALRTALTNGLIDAVATDHAPHTPELKDQPFDDAPPGMLGLEHAASVVLDVLGPKNPRRFFDVLSRRPAELTQLCSSHRPQFVGPHGGEVVAGESASLVVFDPTVTYRVDRAMLQSRSRNSPYHGLDLTGRARHLLVGGHIVLETGSLV